MSAASGSDQRSDDRPGMALRTARQAGRRGAIAFGLGLLTDLAPPGAWSPRPLEGPLLELRSATAAAIAERWSGTEAVGWEGTIDGARFVVERGHAGDHRFVHGAPPAEDGTPTAATRAVHHLCADARVLSCAPSDPDDPSWWRELLDSTLFTAALLRGYEALHAGAVATPYGAIAITAASGGGKSTLLSELLIRGSTLLADDVLVLESRGVAQAPRAHPAPPLMTVPSARVALLREALAPGTPTIATFAQEQWLAVPVHPEPLPLAGVVVLNRAPGLAPALHREAQPLTALLAGLLRFPRTRARERTRFEMAGAIAAHAPVWRLDADPGVSPATLSELLLAELSAIDATSSEPAVRAVLPARQPIVTR
ncbi:MAG TPA: hypothetical protein VGL37_02315 [Solirubrobacteraceae bacterium]